jgi:hypothetical protein
MPAIRHITACHICQQPVELATAKADENGKSVHEECYVATVSGKLTKKPELLITVTPSGSPLLKGNCSACPHLTFAFVGDTAENRRLMQLAFEKHVKDVHQRDDRRHTNR